jgi:hypothetical protein
MTESETAVGWDGSLRELSPSVGCVGHSRFTTTAAVQVQAALRICAQGERISWDVALQLVPTPSGPRPMLLIYLAAPSAILGELCGEVVLIEPQNVNDFNIETNVRGAVERIRQARSESTHRPGPRHV